MRSCSRKRERAASMSTSSEIQSRDAGGATDYPDLLANWRQNFFGWNKARLDRSRASADWRSERATAVAIRILFGLRLQPGVILFDERSDVIGHIQHSSPLLFVKSDRETAQSVNRYAPLFANFQGHASRAQAFQPF